MRNLFRTFELSASARVLLPTNSPRMYVHRLFFPRSYNNFVVKCRRTPASKRINMIKRRHFQTRMHYIPLQVRDRYCEISCITVIRNFCILPRVSAMRKACKFVFKFVLTLTKTHYRERTLVERLHHIRPFLLFNSKPLSQVYGLLTPVPPKPRRLARP